VLDSCEAGVCMLSQCDLGVARCIWGPHFWMVFFPVLAIVPVLLLSIVIVFPSPSLLRLESAK